MTPLSRRDFLGLGLAAATGLGRGEEPRPANVHRQLLDLAAKQEERRRAKFAAVKSKADLDSLQKELRASFLRLLDGLPEAKGPPPAKVTGTIEADDYRVEKLAFES